MTKEKDEKTDGCRMYSSVDSGESSLVGSVVGRGREGTTEWIGSSWIIMEKLIVPYDRR